MGVQIEMRLVNQIIATLKSIDVRGYESMSSLVGLVMLFEDMSNSAARQAEQPVLKEVKPEEKEE